MTSRVLSPLTRVLTYGTCVGLPKVLKGVFYGGFQGDGLG
jgi:hypothetical protein